MRPYLDAQLSGDRAAALRLVIDDGLGGGVAVPDLHLGVVQPAQREIGRLWQENRISVAQEHLATAISQLVVSHLYRSMPREPHNGRLALVACVEGELHDMGGRMGADFLEMAGFDVRFLGADVPTPSLLEMIDTERPDVVGLSVAMTYHLPSLIKAVQAIRAAHGRELPILVGGHVAAWAPGLQRALDVQVVGTNADELVLGCRELLAC
jgi:methanogenic corrinoid protein MtbC1